MIDDEVTVAFVCVQNAGRSQMATAFAKREMENRNLGNRVEILTGGTNPADSVHQNTVEVMIRSGEAESRRTDRYPRCLRRSIGHEKSVRVTPWDIYRSQAESLTLRQDGSAGYRGRIWHRDRISRIHTSKLTRPV